MPLSANQFVWTVQDELDRMLVSSQQTLVGRQRQLARTAILNVLREFPNRHRWSYYNRRHTFSTVAADMAATATYDHSGGAYERLLTLASATLPTDGTGEFYRVIIDSVHYSVSRVLSSTTCQLDANNNPGADVAAGTDCDVYRNFYPMPVGFRRLAHVWDIDQECELEHIAEDEQHALSVSVFDTPDTPEWCTLTNRGETLAQLGLVFAPPPLTAIVYDLLYEAAPQAIQTWLYSDGRATTDGTTTVTLSDGGATSSKMVGSILRVSSNAGKAPTPLVGGLDGDNPYHSERLILEAPTPSTLTVDRAIDALTAVSYTISDPLDLEPGAMLLAFQRACDAEFAYLMGHESWNAKRTLAHQALLLAMENDQRAPYSRSVPPVDQFRRPTITTD